MSHKVDRFVRNKKSNEESRISDLNTVLSPRLMITDFLVKFSYFKNLLSQNIFNESPGKLLLHKVSWIFLIVKYSDLMGSCLSFGATLKE